MKICFLGPANSTHIHKWVKWFSQQGHEIHVISFFFGKIEEAHVHLIDVGVDADDKDIKKIKYIFTGKKIRGLIDEIKPDVINAHYASSYGVAIALSGITGYVLSVWGSDIYDFPNKSPIHKALLEFSLKKAGCLFSTSRAMADEAAKYTNKAFEITPFGVDLEVFNPNKKTRTSDESFIIGTVKSLSNIYGIQYILEAAAFIKDQNSIPIKVRIAGNGPQEQEYHQMADALGIGEITTWLGFISQEQAAEEWANMDVALLPSESESFGVSAVEAQACGTPVIISDIPGLMEATKPGETSIVVKRNSTKELIRAIMRLYGDAGERHRLGKNGLEYVRGNYELNHCFEHIEELLKKNTR